MIHEFDSSCKGIFPPTQRTNATPHLRNPIQCRSWFHWRFEIKNSWFPNIKVGFTVILFIRSHWYFAHAMTAKLSWHVQKFQCVFVLIYTCMNIFLNSKSSAKQAASSYNLPHELPLSHKYMVQHSRNSARLRLVRLHKTTPAIWNHKILAA